MSNAPHSRSADTNDRPPMFDPHGAVAVALILALIVIVLLG